MQSRMNYEQYNPFRQPDWRYARVLEMVKRTPQPGRSSSRDDKWVRGLRQFILRYNTALADEDKRVIHELQYGNPGLYFAYELHRRMFDDPELVFMLKARLLAGQTNEEICHCVHTIPEAIEWFEKLFFNVRDRLQARDWIVKHVLFPSIQEAEATNEAAAIGENQQGGNTMVRRRPIATPLWDPRILWFAYFFGPVGVDFALTGFVSGEKPQSPDDVSEAWYQFVHKNLGRMTGLAVHGMEVTKYNVMELISVYGQFVSVAKNAQDQAQQQDGVTKAVGAMLNEANWLIGRAGSKAFEGSAIEAFDNSPVELRTRQLLSLASGAGLHEQELEQISERMKGLPPPRKMTEVETQKDLIDADAKHGS